MVKGTKMALKGQIVRATKLNEKDKKKYYEELSKYDISTLRKILKFRKFVGA